MNIIRKPDRTLRSLAASHWKSLSLSVFFGLLFSGTTLMPPLVVRGIIADILNTNSEGIGSITVLAIALLGLFIIRGLSRYCYGITSHMASYSLLSDLLIIVYEHIQQLSHRFFDKNSTGNLIARSVSDVEEIEDFVAHGIPELVQAFIIPIAMVIILLTIDPILTGIVLIPLPIAAILVNLLTRSVRGMWRKVRERYARIVAVIEDNLLGMNEIKSFRREDRQLNQLKALSSDYRTSMIHATNKSLLPVAVVEMGGGLGVILATLYGGNLAFMGELTIADFYVFLAYLSFIYQPFLKLADIGEVLQKAMASYRRIADILIIKSEIVNSPTAITPSTFPGTVEFNQVSFSYERGTPVLNKIDFSITSGEVVSLVGSSGAGKTTVTRLVPRFYDVESGIVRVAGHDVRDLELGFLRRQIAMVSQDVFLFRGSVYENILFGRKGATEQEVKAAAQAANADGFIRFLPDGYETIVGDRGTRLSGGQRQRISIARAILKNAPILIFDEATSSVDPEAEQVIQETLEVLLNGRTAIVIAHRQSTIERADRLIVIESGQVIESGTSAELLSSGKRYRNLVKAETT